MAVDVVCPHCETQFHLQPEVLGKAMRCPECKDVFTAESLDLLPPPLPPPPLPKEVPYERIENAPPVILDAEPVATPKRAVLLPPIPVAVPVAEPVAPPPRAARIAEPAEPVAPPRVARILEPAVKVADWREAPPKLAGETLPLKTEVEVPTKKRDVWPLVLTSLIVLTVMLVGGAVAKYFYDESRREENLAVDAAATFKDRNWPDAARQYQELLDKYPESPSTDRYKFFKSLSDLQSSVGSSTLKENPSLARGKWDAFIKDFGGTALAKPDDDGYGLDVYDAGRKLADGYAIHAEDLLKKYRAELAKIERLTTAEQTVAEGRAFIPIAERFRPKDEKRLDDAAAKYEAVSGECVRERKRLDVLAPYRDIANDPVEERIADFTAALARGGLSDDAEAKALIAAANAKLRSLLKAVVDLTDPQKVLRATGGDAPFVTVATPAGRVSLPTPPPDAVPETFFAVARGWLYALDLDTAELCWAERVGPVPPPFRIESNHDLVLVPSLVDGQSRLTARNARTGKAEWYQPLAAPIAGTPAFVGSRVYVPLDDAAGTLIEFDTHSGKQISHFRLRQRIGAGIVRVPNTTLIAVVADARRIFFLDVAPMDAQGDRQPMRLRHVLKTDHAGLSVRVPPTLTGDAAITMILLQQEGTNATKVRAIALPEIPPGSEISESSVVDLAAATLPGQVTFPPASDGERVAIATDVGALAIYRTNAPGNLDSGLFTVPTASLPQNPREPLPALAALTHEDGIWVFSRGLRTLLTQSFSPVAGFKAIVRGTPIPIGIPRQAIQRFDSRGNAGVVVQSEQSDSIQSVLFDAASGRIIWERTLGAVAAVPPIPTNDGVLLVDADGGVQRLKTVGGAERIAAPLLPTASAAKVVREGDGVWILVPLAGDKVQIRHVVGGKLALDVEAALPAALAGAPVLLGGKVVVPLADGFLHRFDATAFVAGPMWRGATADPRAVSELAAIGDQVFASDGGRRLGRWKWGAEWTSLGSPIELRGAPAFAPVMLSPTELLVADVNGGVALFDLNKPGDPVQRWRPSDDQKPAIPAGKPTLGFQRFKSGVIVYGVDNKTLVAVQPGQPHALWVILRKPREFDILDLAVIDDVLIVTDLAGNLTAYSSDGKLVHAQVAKSRDVLPRSPPSPFGPDKLIVPATDGTATPIPALRKTTP